MDGATNSATKQSQPIRGSISSSMVKIKSDLQISISNSAEWYGQVVDVNGHQSSVSTSVWSSYYG